MLSQSGRYFVIYNGEVYNFREFSEQLEAMAVDTEVIVIQKLFYPLQSSSGELKKL